VRRVERSAETRYSAAQMFDLVEDVQSYPRFLHWCRGASVTRISDRVMEASLDIGVRGIHKSFRTRNTSDRPQSIRLALVSGPFRHLSGEWRFDERDNGGCRVTLTLDFDVRSSPLNRLFSLVFEELVRAQVSAFLHRADALYGGNGQSSSTQ
jgi:ribosome-associated toxin RatA of RatAB toxin-antitoxin module